MNNTSPKTNTSDTYVLSSGGTGGHLFPALSLADEIDDAGHACHLVTDYRGLAFFRFHDKKPSLVCTIHRKHWLFGRLLYPFSLGFQILKCLIWLSKIKPKAVIGFGGYPSFPCTYAAQWLKIPTYIHEGNAFLGKANRALKPKAKKIALSFPPTAKEEINDPRFHVTGMPVRGEVCILADMPYEAPAQTEPFYLLVIGGSQGAKIFGTLLPEAIALLAPELQKRLIITQQCREQQLRDVKKAYKKLGCQTVLKTFLSPIDIYYKEAHLVIARSGASTVAEVAIAGKPTLFVPFQGSVEGDQARNAENLCKANAAWVMREASLTPAKLAEFITNQMTSAAELVQKAEAIRSFSHPDATQKLWAIIKE